MHVSYFVYVFVIQQKKFQKKITMAICPTIISYH